MAPNDASRGEPAQRERAIARASTDTTVVDAEVGEGRTPACPVPETVGAFSHRECPNNSTTTWKREWRPTDDPYPRVELIYRITTQSVDGWTVVRSVQTRERTQTVNVPSPSSGVCFDVRDTTTVATAPTRAGALEIVVDCLRAASALPTETPPVVCPALVASYQDLKAGGDGTVDAAAIATVDPEAVDAEEVA